MQHTILKILSTLLAIALLVASCLFYAIYISPDRLTTKYDSISSTKVPESLDNVTIGYFSDIYYGEFMKQDRFQAMIDKINEADVDILLFGGDLFYDPANQKINAKTKKKITQMLSSIKAPLGKFYVLGDIDRTNKDTKTLVKSILYNAGYEECNNRRIKLHNGKVESINLIGIANEINGNPNVTKAFKNVGKKTFNIVFGHTPDSLANIPENTVDLAVAGHSLGGSIRFPLLGSFKQIEGATKYNYGTYSFNDTFIRISNGLGTHTSDMRLFCPPQFNVFVLRKQEMEDVVKETPKTDTEKTNEKTKQETTKKKETKTEDKK